MRAVNTTADEASLGNRCYGDEVQNPCNRRIDCAANEVPVNRGKRQYVRASNKPWGGSRRGGKRDRGDLLFLSLLLVFPRALLLSLASGRPLRGREGEDRCGKSGGRPSGRRCAKSCGCTLCNRIATYVSAHARSFGRVRRFVRRGEYERDNISASVSCDETAAQTTGDATRCDGLTTHASRPAAFSICLSALSSVLPIAEQRDRRDAPLPPSSTYMSFRGSGAYVVRNVTIIAHSALRPRVPPSSLAAVESSSSPLPSSSSARLVVR